MNKVDKSFREYWENKLKEQPNAIFLSVENIRLAKEAFYAAWNHFEEVKMRKQIKREVKPHLREAPACKTVCITTSWIK